MRRESALFAVSRLSAAAASFYVLSLAAYQLDASQFLLVAALSSYYAVSGLLDFGVGYAVQSLAAERDRSEHLAIVLSGARPICLLAAVILPVLAIIAALSSEPWLVGTGLLMGLVYLPLTLVERYRAVRQEMAATAAFTLVAAGLIVVTATAVALTSAADWLGVVSISVNVVVASVHAGLILRRGRGSRQIPVAARRASIRRRSFGFMVIQVSGAVTLQSGLFFLAWLSTPEKSQGFPAALRLAATGAGLLASFALAVQPHLAATPPAQLAREVRRALSATILLSSLCAVSVGLAGLGLFDAPVRLILADEAPDRGQLALAAAFITSFTLLSGLNQIALGLGAIKSQTLFATANAVGCLGLVPAWLLLDGPSSTLLVSSLVLLAAWSLPTALRLKGDVSRMLDRRATVDS